MKQDDAILGKLTQFQERALFSDEAWRARGLNPSAAGLSRELTLFFHDVARELARVVAEGGSRRKLKGMLTRALGQLDKSRYDREEKEFIAGLFHELSGIVGVDMNNKLNGWLYDRVLAFLISTLRRRERILETRSQPCTNCGTSQDIHVTRRRDDIPDHAWFIVRCQECLQLNLLSAGPGIQAMKFGHCERVENLAKAEYTYEQALQRMEQIQHFRKF